MKRRSPIFLLTVLILLAASIFMYCSSRPTYTISEDISTIDQNSLEGVTFSVKANRKQCEIIIKNETDTYLVLDFQPKPFTVEILQEDGWHELVSSQLYIGDTESVTQDETFTKDFLWKDFLQSNLKPGTYRAVLRYGDGKLARWDWYTIAAEFTVE